ncbi:hypothetical protein A3D11_03935 [Candidatus Peribacteria bacterium RIFCSPHIGHO2_02_FULL_49_16]|nr:MAG: hypothetical protein A2880_03170 [Candidatus Peribacteria bacterium RIFCSPHIGHO2_01_FULL_49_38]OGJ59152.1 MAG: hypothetical protein A3D11_03935 [Candidatus Peribacteria bacterium RIFCSPHIGHO2_02_FULL_49_16]
MTTTNGHQRLSFTADFYFENGKAYFTGFALETVVSVNIGAKYQVLVKREDGKFWSLKKMESPLSQDDVQKVIDELGGSIMGEEFLFKVFDKNDKEIFGTRFNVSERIPPDGYSNDKLVMTNYSWVFDLPEYLQQVKIEFSNSIVTT